MNFFVRKMWFYGLIFDVFQKFDNCGCISKLFFKSIWKLCLWIIIIIHLITFVVYSCFKITTQHWFLSCYLCMCWFTRSTHCIFTWWRSLENMEWDQINNCVMALLNYGKFKLQTNSNKKISMKLQKKIQNNFIHSSIVEHS